MTKEPLWQSPSKEERRENNSAHSLLVHVFTQAGPEADIMPYVALFSPAGARIGRRPNQRRVRLSPWTRGKGMLRPEFNALVGDAAASGPLQTEGQKAPTSVWLLA